MGKQAVAEMLVKNETRIKFTSAITGFKQPRQLLYSFRVRLQAFPPPPPPPSFRHPDRMVFVGIAHARVRPCCHCELVSMTKDRFNLFTFQSLPPSSVLLTHPSWPAVHPGQEHMAVTGVHLHDRHCWYDGN